MASFYLLSSPLPFRYSQDIFFHPSGLGNASSKVLKFQIPFKFTPCYQIKLNPVRVSVNGDNGAIETPSPPRRGREKKPQSSSPSSSSSTPSKQSKRSRKTKVENGTLEVESAEEVTKEVESNEEIKTLSPSSLNSFSDSPPAEEVVRSRKTEVENGTLEVESAEEVAKEVESNEKIKTLSRSPLNSFSDSPPVRSRKTEVENGTLEVESAEEVANEGEKTDEIKTQSTSYFNFSSPVTPAKESSRGRRTLVELGIFEPKPATETVNKAELTEEDFENYDDGIDFPYDNPPLICCFGAAQNEFLPMVRVQDYPMDPDIYSEWKMLQWKPPEFGRAPGGPVSNVAIAHVRLGGRAAFMGKVGDDSLGDELVSLMNIEKVQTRAVKFDSNVRTGCTYMKVKFEGGKMKMEVVKESAEDSLKISELNLAVLKEARIFHFNSEVFTSPSMQSTLFKAIAFFKKHGGHVFFDPNLPLPLWKSRDETRKLINQAWSEADIIEVSMTELEFLIDEEYCVRKRNYRPQYYAESYEQTKRKQRDYYHYTPEEISPLWHDKLKVLFVTDGTLRIHYYTPNFHGAVIGTEDVLVTPYTCDRTGSGDAIVAAIIRKLTTCPEMFENKDVMEKQIRFAIAAGIIAQWTIGAVRCFPTESAAQNLKEQVYVPSLW